MAFRVLPLLALVSFLGPFNGALANQCKQVLTQPQAVQKVEFGFGAELQKKTSQYDGYKLSQAKMIAEDPNVQAYFQARNITKVFISEIKYYGAGIEVVAFFSYLGDPPSDKGYPNRGGLAATFYIRPRPQPAPNGSLYFISST